MSSDLTDIQRRRRAALDNQVPGLASTINRQIMELQEEGRRACQEINQEARLEAESWGEPTRENTAAARGAERSCQELREELEEVLMFETDTAYIYKLRQELELECEAILGETETQSEDVGEEDQILIQEELARIKERAMEECRNVQYEVAREVERLRAQLLAAGVRRLGGARRLAPIMRGRLRR